MNLKQHLKAICDYEQSVYEQNAKLEYAKYEYEAAKKRVEERKQELSAQVSIQNKKIEELKKDNAKRQTINISGLRNASLAAAISLVTTIFFHVILNTWLTNGYQAALPGDSLLPFFVMNILPTILVTCLFYMFTEHVVWPFVISYIIINATSISYVYMYIEKHSATMGDAIFAAAKFFVIVEAIVFTLLILSIIKDYNKDEERNKQIIYRNNKEIQKLKKNINECQEKITLYNISSTKALSQMLKDIDAQCKDLNKSKEELKKLYNMNIVHPKYQNWVAVATMYEYIDVGRCNELIGPHGAYNLYEKEMTTNKILNSLNSINASINSYGSSISESQRYIKSQLRECNSRLLQIEVNTYGL